MAAMEDSQLLFVIISQDFYAKPLHKNYIYISHACMVCTYAKTSCVHLTGLEVQLPKTQSGDPSGCGREDVNPHFLGLICRRAWGDFH